MTQLPDLLTVAEVAEAARVSDETVHRWAREGKLPHIKLPSGLKRFPRDGVEAMLRGEQPAGSVDAA
ncbi:helix-turn-helix domain-containing protein [Micromonospora sp. WMMD1102]|uniref:helix-turn-helix domain-containing protein n=1 Tax=Micromonospora sp. WMMD1102 TaxID=3016105 RepID=UPI002414D60E|nr:helix-turn-helix domain-containing protein [Micromonospora sp. WMMD1102]MDG4784375.1 helix-turn-helix domain-containing protein [Micromonospora sp. WMMD1102]MDG4792193.1 helix-turn-helix domain-containing protein [Micromonospora sp. WMMD1102]